MAIAMAGMLVAWIAVNNVKRGVVAAVTGAIRPVSATGDSSWSAYLNGSTHQSYNAAEMAISPVNVRRLTRAWIFRGFRARGHGQPRSEFLSSPTVVGGVVYIGSDAGWFYELDAATGAVLAKRFMGFQPARTCKARGFVDTATVEVDPADGQRTVYVAAANGFLYALRASDLSVKWSSLIAIPSPRVSDYFQWSSPTVVRGRIYIGISSNCDHPLVRGGLVSFSQATGKRLAVFRTLPGGGLGGSIWSSAAVGPNGDVFVSTGNPRKGKIEAGYSDALVKLDPVTLRPLASFAVPVRQVVPDGDFGGSPTIFGQYVGACDKNGIYYALRWATMKLAWSARIGATAARHGISNCSAAAIFDGRHLYLAGPAATVGGRTFRGSIAELDPVTGRVLWRTGLPNGVIGSPAMDGAGVIAVGTYDFSSRPNAIYLVSAASGKILRRLVKGSRDFAQSVFADGLLFTATGTGISAWRLR